MLARGKDFSDMNTFCTVCGSPLPDAARFCEECGATLSAREAGVTAAMVQPMTIDPLGSSRGHARSASAMRPASFCSQCGSQLQHEARFCARCGVALTSFPSSVEMPLLSRNDRHVQRSPLLASLFTMAVTGAAGYVATKRWMDTKSPSDTVRALIIAANDQNVDKFQTYASTWLIGELKRNNSATSALKRWSQSGTIENLDILAERTCAQEAEVAYRLRFRDGQAQEFNAHLVSEHGIWRLNDFNNPLTCGLDAGQRWTTQPPIASWPISRSPTQESARYSLPVLRLRLPSLFGETRPGEVEGRAVFGNQLRS